jgi:hypothetical protein
MVRVRRRGSDPLADELGNDYAVLLTVYGSGEVSTTLWYGNGEHDLTSENRDSFRRWLDEAVLSQDCGEAA